MYIHFLICTSLADPTHFCSAVEHEALQNLQPGSQSPYNICRSYQRLASTIAMNFNAPPTTRVSDDGMSISFREHTLYIPIWREALAKLAVDTRKMLDDLCYGDNFGLTVPAVIADDWTNETRGYSWTGNDPNGFGLQSKKPLLCRMLCDHKLKLARNIKGRLQLNKLAIAAVLRRCDEICKKLFLLVFFTTGQPPRITEIADYKYANSTRARNMFHHDGAIWFVNRRLKPESLLRKESAIPSKASKQITNLLEKYLLLVRPLEKELSYHLLEGVDQTKACQLYSEYMWMQSGTMMTSSDLRALVSSFLHKECKVNIGYRIYRQICVEIGRVFLGSEAEIEAEEQDLLALQMGHSLRMARSHYALEAGRLPGMSSDLLLRYGRISEAWWSVTGFRAGSPPLEPLQLRRKLAADAAAKHHNIVQELLAAVATLRREVKRLERKQIPHVRS